MTPHFIFQASGVTFAENTEPPGWTYVFGIFVTGALGWNLKSWYGLLMPNRQRGLELVQMEFRRFLHAIVLLPAQIVRSGRRIIYRIMGYNSWLKDFFAAWENFRRLAPA